MTDRTQRPKLSHNSLLPGRKIRATAKEVRQFVLELGDLTECYQYNGHVYTVKWKGCGLGMAEIWMEKRP